MSIDLWSQFVDYLSAPSIGGFVRWVVPAFSGVLLIVKNIQVILDNLDSNRLFGLRYKIRAHKYLSLIDNVEGLEALRILGCGGGGVGMGSGPAR